MYTEIVNVTFRDSQDAKSNDRGDPRGWEVEGSHGDQEVHGWNPAHSLYSATNSQKSSKKDQKLWGSIVDHEEKNMTQLEPRLTGKG